MIRTILILSLSPFLAGCDLEDLINPGASSRAAYEYRQAGLIQHPEDHFPEVGNMVLTPIPPTVEVAETAPEVVEVVVPEPVYVPPEPQKPSCQPVYAIFNCSEEGLPIWL